MNFKPKFEKKKDSDASSTVKKYEPITKYMAKKLITFTANTELIEVINSLLENQISGAPVLNDDKEIVGVIDDKDCLHTLVDSVYHNAPIRKKQVKSYMTDVYKTIHIDSDIVDAANMFLKGAYKRLLVVDDNGKLKGTISRGDILRAIREVDNTNWRKQE
jgi:predicted transcriptional regulator